MELFRKRYSISPEVSKFAEWNMEPLEATLAIICRKPAQKGNSWQRETDTKNWKFIMTSSSSELLDSATPETCMPLLFFFFPQIHDLIKSPVSKKITWVGFLSRTAEKYLIQWVTGSLPQYLLEKKKKKLPLNYLLALAPAHLLKLVVYLAFSHTLCLLAIPGAPQLVLRQTFAFAVLSNASVPLPDCHLPISLSGFRTQLGWGLPSRCSPVTLLSSLAQPSHICDAFLCTESFTSFPLVSLGTMMLLFPHHNWCLEQWFLEDAP